MLPNFLVLGTAKAGTDSLYNYLNQHPQIYLSPQKELNFFAHEGRVCPFRGPGDADAMPLNMVTTFGEFHAQFAGVDGQRAVGEVATHYLYYPEAPERIERYLPDVRMLAILRNPVDRAFSAFSSLVRDCRETTPDFSEALAQEDARIEQDWEPLWHYRAMGFYDQQVQRYLRRFDRDRLRFILYDDFVRNPERTVQEIFRFLDVDPQFCPDMSERANVSVVPKHWALHRLSHGNYPVKTIAKAVVPAGPRQAVKRLVASRNLQRPTLSVDVRQQLVNEFRPSNIRLGSLIQRDLSIWLGESGS
jgi:hypothetical protein